MDDPDYNNFSEQNEKAVERDAIPLTPGVINERIGNSLYSSASNEDYVQNSVKLINTIKEGIDLKKSEEINSS